MIGALVISESSVKLLPFIDNLLLSIIPVPLRDDYESEPETGNECRSMTSSGSLSNTPKPSIDPLGQATGQPQLGYHHHHQHHSLHHQLQHDASDAAINGNHKPKIWSLAQTATSCTPSSAPHYCRGASLSPPPGQVDQHPGSFIAYQAGYSSVFNVSKMDHRSSPSPHDSAALLYRGYPSAFKTAVIDHQDHDVAEKQPTTGGRNPWLGPHTLSAPSAAAPYYIYNNHLQQQQNIPAMNTNKSSACLNNELCNVTMDKETLSDSAMEKSCVLSNTSTNHIISTQDDTPPQTPPSAQQQGSVTNNNNNVGGTVAHGLSMGTYAAAENGAATYTPSFQGLKNMFEQSTFLGKICISLSFHIPFCAN